MSSIEADLTADIGGDPSTQERLLIQAAAVKALRLSLLADQLLDGGDIVSDQHNVLAWSNSLRNDLKALGLERRARSIPTSRSKRLVEHFAAPYRSPEAAE